MRGRLAWWFATVAAIASSAVAVEVAAAPAATARWRARCKARFAKLERTLRPLGRTAIAVTPGGKHDAERFGTITITVDAKGGRMQATAGDDRSGTRYRGRLGIESKRYEVWHSPYRDSINGDPPKQPVRAVHLELHHRIDVGVLGGVIVVEGATRAAATRFETAVKSTIEACVNDVTPDEADPSLAWTTKCLAELAAAHASLAKADAFFKDAKCERRPFNASCGRIDGPEPRWNALTSLAGLNDKAPRRWTPDGPNRASYGGDALLWAGPTMPAARYRALSDAFRAPLERCSRLRRAARP